MFEKTGGQLQDSHESAEIRYWCVEDVPAWHELHEQYATAAFAAWQDRQQSVVK
jgi:hypothetical protein